MKPIPLVLPCLAVVAAAALSADPPKPVDTSFLKRYAETRGFMLGRPVEVKVTPDGKAVLFLRAAATVPKQSLFEFDVATGKTKELLSPEMLLKGAEENLSPEEKARRERQRVLAAGFVDYDLDEAGGRVLVMLSGRVYVFDRKTANVRELKTGQGTIVDPKWSPDGKFVGYVRDYDVYAYDLAADKELAVTTGGTAVKTHGLAEFVAQEEMNRHTGYWWSPDSKSIAYAEADHAGVEVWYVADPFRPDVKPQEQFYPRPGHKNVAVRLGIKPVAGGETVWVEWDREKFEYLAAVKWDEPALTVQIQDRKQQHLALLKVDPATGKTTKLLEEHDDAFLNLRQDQPQWLPDGRGFLWLASEADPQPLKWYAPDGTLKESVLNPHAGHRVVNGIVSVSRDGKNVAVAVQDETSDDVSLGPVRRPSPSYRLFGLGEGRGSVPAVSLAPDHRLAAVTSTDLRHMPRTRVLRLPADGTGDSTLVGTLPSVALDPPFQPKPEIEHLGDLWPGVVRPRDFDPKKKYPVVLSVYGGPTHNVVVQAMGRWLVSQWLADQGFVVVSLDNRGTPGRGRDWERAIYQKFGTVPLEDQVKGLHALCDKYPELDRERVGMVGWSFGGYMSANAVLRRPDVFKAAVAGAPATDWEDYDTHYTERYLGLLPESKRAYEESSLIPLAKDLKRPLLLVHGTADDNVYFRHTLKLSDALLRAGRDFELLPLPGITHMYTADPQVAERFWARAVGFFKQHLGEPR
jgi:dipeptidyl-peptidase-4